MKNVNENTLRVLLSIYLIFCQYQPGVAYKSVAYKTKRVEFSESGITEF